MIEFTTQAMQVSYFKLQLESSEFYNCSYHSSEAVELIVLLTEQLTELFITKSLFMIYFMLASTQIVLFYVSINCNIYVNKLILIKIKVYIHKIVNL